MMEWKGKGKEWMREGKGIGKRKEKRMDEGVEREGKKNG